MIYEVEVTPEMFESTMTRMQAVSERVTRELTGPALTFWREATLMERPRIPHPPIEATFGDGQKITVGDFDHAVYIIVKHGEGIVGSKLAEKIEEAVVVAYLAMLPKGKTVCARVTSIDELEEWARAADLRDAKRPKPN